MFPPGSVAHPEGKKAMSLVYFHPRSEAMGQTHRSSAAEMSRYKRLFTTIPLRQTWREYAAYPITGFPPQE